MLPANNRLNLRFHRQRLSSQGKTIHSPYFTYLLSSTQSEVSSPTRLALIVSKKLIPTSVGRNRFRRHITEHLRLIVDLLPPNTDIILIPKKTSFMTDISVLIEDIKQTLNHSHDTPRSV